MSVGGACGNPSLRSAIQEAKLQQVRLNNIHDGIRFFADGGGDGFQSHRPPTELLDDAALERACGG